MMTDEPRTPPTPQQTKNEHAVPILRDRLEPGGVRVDNLLDDIIDFDLEKMLRDPDNEQTWIYEARFLSYSFTRVAAPKGISCMTEPRRFQ